jgi:hypothetical protein
VGQIKNTKSHMTPSAEAGPGVLYKEQYLFASEHCCGSGRIWTFFARSGFGSRRLGPDPDPGLNTKSHITPSAEVGPGVLYSVGAGPFL